MNGGIGSLGSTSVWKVSRRSPPRYLRAATSVMAALPGDPPVVSTSTTQNVTSDRGTSWSSVAWSACTPPPIGGPRGG